MAITRRKFIVFAAVTATLAVLLPLMAALAADLYLHSRAEKSAGLNRWGYRGPVVGKKRKGELRVVVLGGSTVFGYGVRWDESIPALLEQKLNAHAGDVPARVVNLGFNNEGVHAFRPTLQDFDYLDYDVVCLYEGYNDLNGDSHANRALYRHDSAVFRLTGYYPILPLVLDEKALLLRYGSLGAAYAAGGTSGKTVFRPNLADRTSATVLEAADAVSTSVGRQLDRLSPKTPVAAISPAGCAVPWTHYCDSIFVAGQYALERGRSVAIVAQPHFEPTDGPQRHLEQQRALADMVRRKFAGESHVGYVDLQGAVNLKDAEFTFDGMHLTAKGNALIAQELVEPVRRLAAARISTASP